MTGSSPPLSVDGIVSGLAFVVSGLLPWTRSGAGSSLRGMELAAALRSGAGLPDWAPKAALAIIALAVLGLVHIGSAVSVSVAVRRFRMLSGLAVLIGLIWTASGFTADRWGAGLMCAAVGAVIAVGAGAVHELRRGRAIEGERQ